MKRSHLLGASLALFLALPCSRVHGQSAAAAYTDSRGKRVEFPLGDASFADEVVTFENGTPPAREAKWSEAKLVLGPPNYIAKNAASLPPAAVTLGCGGVVTVRFTDNTLVDVPGPDLYVFETGPAVEPTSLTISLDGDTWLDVGSIRGGTAYVDISKVAQPGAAYRYVRLTDLKRGCGGPWPGADVDAVGAIGSRLELSFDASVLFDVDRSTLKPEARSALADAAVSVARYADASITVEGHTDSTGSAPHNLTLSQARAESVRTFLLSRPELSGRSITARGFGATRPVASNGDDAGRQKNRRVQIIIDPRR
jgi:OmpA-OmpF porin, OOP family